MMNVGIVLLKYAQNTCKRIYWVMTFTFTVSLVSILSGVKADEDWWWEPCAADCAWGGGCTCGPPWWWIGPPISIRGLLAIGRASTNPPEALVWVIDEGPADGAALDGKEAGCTPGCKLGWRFWCTADNVGPRSRPEPLTAAAAREPGSRRYVADTSLL